MRPRGLTTSPLSALWWHGWPLESATDGRASLRCMRTEELTLSSLNAAIWRVGPAPRHVCCMCELARAVLKSSSVQ